ncbi:hypothetical protein NL676_026613 [Syzygium grande]|nr:hypothetical protein NL676_026613 [Syzygium grande]
MDPCNSYVGTIAYMSPERINTDLNYGKYNGYAGDIWSFRVSILQLYLGHSPFAVSYQGDWASLMCAICMSEPPRPPPHLPESSGNSSRAAYSAIRPGGGPPTSFGGTLSF